MFHPRAVAAALCLASCTGAASAQSTNLYVFRDIDLGTSYGAVSIHTTGNPAFIGNNPSCIELGNDALYVGGWNFTGATTQLGLVKISGLYDSIGLSAASFNRFAQYASNANGRGIVSLKYYRRSIGAGAFESRLVCAADEPGIDTFKLFDAEPAVPTLLAATPVGSQITRSGSAGAAFDWGANGQGYVYGASSTPRPVVCGMRFGDKMFFGVDDAMDPDFSPFSFPSPPRLLPDGVGNTEWRGSDIDPRDGTMLASANDSVVVALRTSDGSFNGKYGNLSVGSPSPTGETAGPRRIYGAAYPTAGVVGRNVRLLRSFPDAGVGELIAWNSRPSGSGGQAFTSVVKFNKYSDGTPVAASYLNPDGTPFTSFPTSVGFYDFAWDAGRGVLAVCDFGNRHVYLLAPVQPGSCALPNAGGCVVLPAAACTSVGGTPGAAGTTCASGACCGTTVGGNAGVCTVLSQQACFSTGTFWTANGVCSPNPCPQPGACCATDGTCAAALSTQCSATSAFVAGGACSPSPCPALGSCCVAGACSSAFQSLCTGTWTSGGSCTPSPCTAASGVCCRGATCATGLTQANCFASGAAGAAFASAAAACNSGTVSSGPCCYANYNKVNGITVQDIFDFLGDWFAGSPYANTGGNGGPGSLSVQNIFDFLSNWFAGGC